MQASNQVWAKGHRIPRLYPSEPLPSIRKCLLRTVCHACCRTRIHSRAASAQKQRRDEERPRTQAPTTFFCKRIESRWSGFPDCSAAVRTYCITQSPPSSNDRHRQPKLQRLRKFVYPSHPPAASLLTLLAHSLPHNVQPWEAELANAKLRTLFAARGYCPSLLLAVELPKTIGTLGPEVSSENSRQLQLLSLRHLHDSVVGRISQSTSDWGWLREARLTDYLTQLPLGLAR